MRESYRCHKLKPYRNAAQAEQKLEMANVVAQIYAHLLQHPFHDPVGLAVCVELRYMTDALMLGEWFE